MLINGQIYFIVNKKPKNHFWRRYAEYSSRSSAYKAILHLIKNKWRIVSIHISDFRYIVETIKTDNPNTKTPKITYSKNRELLFENPNINI